MDSDLKKMLISFISSFFLVLVLFILSLLSSCADTSKINIENTTISNLQKTSHFKSLNYIKEESLSLIKSLKKGDYVILSNDKVFLVIEPFGKNNKSVKLWRPGLFSSIKVELKDAKKIKKVVKAGTREHREFFLLFI